MVIDPNPNLKFDTPIVSCLVTFHLIALGCFFWISGPAVITFGIMYFLTVLGITMGFHRYFTHRSFKAPRWLEVCMALMGTLALQGSILRWVAHHRMHHAGSDTPKDPHNIRNGFWYAHFGWLFKIDPEFDDDKKLARFARDIANDRFFMWLSNIWVMIAIQVALGFVFLFTMGIAGVVWGIFFRLVAVYHVTWLVNSAAHTWGYKNFETQDEARNTWWVGILALGEGWHNNHHAYGHSAKTGYRWWEIDVTWWVIRALQSFRLINGVRVEPEAPNPLNNQPTAPANNPAEALS